MHEEWGGISLDELSPGLHVMHDVMARTGPVQVDESMVLI